MPRNTFPSRRPSIDLPRALRLLAAAAVAASVLAACAKAPQIPLRAPKVSLVDIGVNRVTLFEQQFRLRLRLENPNPIPLPVTGFRFALKINGKEMGQGSSSRSFKLAARGETVEGVDLVTNLGRVFEQVWNASRDSRQSFRYELTGELALGSHLPPLAFRHESEFIAGTQK